MNVRGSDQPLRLVVENDSPGVLAFTRGDTQELRTTGGAHNSAEFEVQATRSGDFKFHARVLSVMDATTAVRYLQAAAGNRADKSAIHYEKPGRSPRPAPERSGKNSRASRIVHRRI